MAYHGNRPYSPAVCRSRYGWHWEIGSSRTERNPPLQIIYGNQGELARATLRQFLQTNATAQTKSAPTPLYWFFYKECPYEEIDNTSGSL